MSLSLRSIASLVIGSALVAACSAAPEDVGSGNQDLPIANIGGAGGTHTQLGGGGGGGGGPGGPVFPPANATYCPTQWSNCSLQNPFAGYATNPAQYASELSELSSVGCNEGMYYQAVGLEGRIAVCWDSPQARAAFYGYLQPEYMCSACLPMLPPGQIYIDINLAVLGDCESTCASGSGSNTNVKATGGKSTVTVKGK